MPVSSLARRSKEPTKVEDDDESESEDDCEEMSEDEGADDDSSQTYLATGGDVEDLSTRLRPKEVVAELERHIVGQSEAKRSVAIALRNRWRRLQLGKCQ